jgi:hypothetical protein
MDDLRNTSTQSPFFSEFGEEPPVVDQVPLDEGPEKRVLGMTAIQRFIVMLLIFVLTCVIGFLCLIVTGKIAPHL